MDEDKVIELAFDSNLETGEVLLKPYPEIVKGSYEAGKQEGAKEMAEEIDKKLQHIESVNDYCMLNEAGNTCFRKRIINLVWELRQALKKVKEESNDR